jgi:molybdopterin/thiamine biosynthesis adenylyltransferase
MDYDYDLAVDRNIGWVTTTEQKKLRNARIAIGGLGGTGGNYLLTLARMGVGNFNIADSDVFEIVNFNRQVGATMSTLGKSKTDVMQSMALDINPELNFRTFNQGLSQQNISSFLEGADIFLDAIDFYELSIRRAVFRACAELNIPAIAASPFGMTAAYMVFMPGGIPFDKYFAFTGDPQQDQFLFLRGLAPKALQKKFLVDNTRFNLSERRGPSSIVGCQLCAAYVAAETLKILLERGPSKPAPYAHQIDAFGINSASTFRRNGFGGLLQQLGLRRHIPLSQQKPSR